MTIIILNVVYCFLKYIEKFGSIISVLDTKNTYMCHENKTFLSFNGSSITAVTSAISECIARWHAYQDCPNYNLYNET